MSGTDRTWHGKSDRTVLGSVATGFRRSHRGERTDALSNMGSQARMLR